MSYFRFATLCGLLACAGPPSAEPVVGSDAPPTKPMEVQPTEDAAKEPVAGTPSSEILAATTLDGVVQNACRCLTETMAGDRNCLKQAKADFESLSEAEKQTVTERIKLECTDVRGPDLEAKFLSAPPDWMAGVWKHTQSIRDVSEKGCQVTTLVTIPPEGTVWSYSRSMRDDEGATECSVSAAEWPSAGTIDLSKGTQFAMRGETHWVWTREEGLKGAAVVEQASLKYTSKHELKVSLTYQNRKGVQLMEGPNENQTSRLQGQWVRCKAGDGQSTGWCE